MEESAVKKYNFKRDASHKRSFSYLFELFNISVDKIVVEKIHNVV
ncbi:hypothetical protein [Haemophilus haemolyticus]|nr:hypothetical protein [Haemophilus haemolyticus]